MGFEWAHESTVDAVRTSILGVELAERLRHSGERFLFPVEDLIESSAHCFLIIENTGLGLGRVGGRNRVDFQSVVDGSVSLDEYRNEETRFVQLVRHFFHAAEERATIQVSYNISPSGRRCIAKYFSGADVDRAEALLKTLKRRHQDTIEVDDVETVELLMRLGLREIAMNTYAFPSAGVFLTNHWDLRLIAYAADSNTRESVGRQAVESGLVTRPLAAPLPGT